MYSVTAPLRTRVDMETDGHHTPTAPIFKRLIIANETASFNDNDRAAIKMHSKANS